MWQQLSTVNKTCRKVLKLFFSNFRQQNCNPIMAISLQKPEYKNSSNTHI